MAIMSPSYELLAMLLACIDTTDRSNIISIGCEADPSMENGA